MQKEKRRAEEMTVKQKQCLLAYYGYDPGRIDGISGPKTQAAANQFQEDRGVSIDSIEDAIESILPDRVKVIDPLEDVNDCNNVSALDSGYPYFSLSEFRCQCNDNNCVGKSLRPSDALLKKLVDIRTRFGAPVTISSGIRCPAHNSEVGGVSNSYHLSGRAADINVRGYTSAQVLAYCSGLQLHYCYAIDGSYVHVDI